MSNEDESTRLAEAFFSLWRQQCITYLHQSEAVGAALRHCYSAVELASKKQEKETNNAVFDDAVAGLFRHMVAQLPECGNSTGAGAQPTDRMESAPKKTSGSD